jgi:hypothetical protein
MSSTALFDPCIPELVKLRGCNPVVTFRTRFFQVGSARYEIVGTESFETDCQHTVKNIDTGEWRRVSGKRILEWFTNK